MTWTILTVDDDDDVRSLIVATLSKYEVIEAADGARGLALACTRRPDLILLDRQLPYLDGMDALRALNENPATSSIPIIILSSLGEVDDRAAGLAAGAFDYITKPFSPARLRERVSGALRQINRWREVHLPKAISSCDRETLASDAPDPEGVARTLAAPGTLIDDKYEIVDPIGTGGMAVVYRARHRLLDQVVAIKLIRSDRAPSPTYQRRFFREARLTSSLDHPNIVGVRDFGRTPDGLLYLVMDLVEGRTLDQLVEAEGALAPSRAVEFTCQILEGLACAHEHGIVHRDVKTSNTMVDEEGRLRLLDFGLARQLNADDDTDPSLTQAGQFIGTPLYMSPEQAAGNPVDHRSDLYSTAVVVYELLCGQPPFTGERSPEIMRRHCTESPIPPSSAGDEVPEGLDAVILKGLAKAPDDRWQSAGAFRDALRAVSSDLRDRAS